jgi:O-methyltransferase
MIGIEGLLNKNERDLVEEVKPFTMLSAERIIAFRDAVLYAEKYQIQGAIVECGVWRGGAMMAAAKTLRDVKSSSRELHLFDTFEGMTKPSAVDRDNSGVKASKLMAHEDKMTSHVWAIASLEDVKDNMMKTKYPSDRMHFIKGRVEDTIPDQAPEKIAVLRLDTDWYESTRHELAHLIPRLSPNGVLIIDDYGHWQGSRKAVDEFIANFKKPILLARTDYTGRMAIVPDQR